MLPNLVSGNARPGALERPPCRPSLMARCVCAVLAAIILPSCGRVPDLSGAVLTSASQVRQLSAAQVRTGVRVRIRGILTYFDGMSSNCFIQDATGGSRVNPGARPGCACQRLAGRSRPAWFPPEAHPPPSSMAAAHQLWDPMRCPKAMPLARHCACGSRNIDTNGWLSKASSNRSACDRPGLMTLEIRSGTATILAKVPSSITVITDDLVDAEVRASGVLGEPMEGQGEPDATLWVSDTTALETIRPAAPPAALPLTRIATLLAPGPARPPAHPASAYGACLTSTSDGGLAGCEMKVGEIRRPALEKFTARP